LFTKLELKERTASEGRPYRETGNGSASEKNGQGRVHDQRVAELYKLHPNAGAGALFLTKPPPPPPPTVCWGCEAVGVAREHAAYTRFGL